jgi:hypothetical protein
MTEVAIGTYGFSTIWEEFTNNQSGWRNHRIVRIIKDATGSEVSRYSEVIAVAAGQTVKVHQNLNNNQSVIFRVFRRDYKVDGTYTETKILENTTDAPFSPTGPR